MSPRTNCCTAKLSWDFLLLQNGRCCIEFILETQPDFWSWETEEERGVPYFCLIKFRIMHVIWKLGEWKMPLFRVLGLSGSSVQFSPVQSAWCAFACCCVLHLFHAFIFIWFYFLWLLFVFALYSYIAAKSKSVPSACSGFPLERFSSIQGLNTCILSLMLQSFTTYYGYNLLRTHDCRIWVCCFGNRLFFKPSW